MALLMIAIISLLYFLISKKEKFQRKYSVKENKDAFAINSKYFFTTNNNKIEKYDKNTGKKIKHKRYNFNKIKDSKIVNGNLIVLVNNRLVWIDIDTMNIINTMIMPMVKPNVSWFDRAWDKWWVCEIDNIETTERKIAKIYCFNDNWDLEGFWIIPNKIIGRKFNRLSGIWFKQYLCICLSIDENYTIIYIMELIGDKVNATVIDKIELNFECQSFAFDKDKNKICLWCADKENIIKYNVNID